MRNLFLNTRITSHSVKITKKNETFKSARWLVSSLLGMSPSKLDSSPQSLRSQRAPTTSITRILSLHRWEKKSYEVKPRKKTYSILPIITYLSDYYYSIIIFFHSASWFYNSSSRSLYTLADLLFFKVNVKGEQELAVVFF